MLRSRLAAAARRIRRPQAGATAPTGAIPIPDQTSAADRAIIERCYWHTMTGVPRLQALIDAVRYCERRGVPGAFAECGVWRGGSVLAMILTLQELGVDDREIHLFDTFEGMTRPTELDTSPVDTPALETWEAAQERGTRAWEYLFEDFDEQMVRDLVLGSGYPAQRLHFVRGRVEETLPAAAPEQIALLRLDTDWYESTRHELVHLFPRVAPGGVLIVDDYGHWEGCARAVDEYFGGEHPPLLFSRVDYSARIAVKA